MHQTYQKLFSCLKTSHKRENKNHVFRSNNKIFLGFMNVLYWTPAGPIWSKNIIAASIFHTYFCLTHIKKTQ